MITDSLSKPQIMLLQSILKNVNTTIRKQTVEALRWRGYINNDELSLTQNGFNKAIESLPLKEQCYFLNIQLQDISLQRESKYPENDAKLYFEKEGFDSYSIGYFKRSVQRKVFICHSS
ncbi:MAG: hypothetical protein PHQ93_05265 [Sulfurimonas sp.]|uniref:hypothetical protein n=1 Tax=Sulfurimonas sp. TaxID=2022749 RepID=UPI00262720A4|nr:hypothetical protein [Sulfurimonas sp.]MDD5400580.1 hypothetical protein [Sulfurimonas sp.]